MIHVDNNPRLLSTIFFFDERLSLSPKRIYCVRFHYSYLKQTTYNGMNHFTRYLKSSTKLQLTTLN